MHLGDLVNQLNANSFEVDPSISTLLSESIEVLGSLLGDRAKQAIYVCLEKQGLQRQHIPEYLSRFEVFLEDNFGEGWCGYRKAYREKALYCTWVGYCGRTALSVELLR